MPHLHDNIISRGRALNYSLNPYSKNVRRGRYSSPLSWTNPPANTKSFVLIVDDPDVPRGRGCTGYFLISGKH
ncbi:MULTISPECIES: hypothetical protein [Legionella]|uniref:hypothetical protein n=1 Tax=Legionella TaxID=445 RepID=UPI002D7959E4|nr:hypothetical protein [Legionella septentrionalis]